MTTASDSSDVPIHLGLILDGNRRWAKNQGLPGLEGHRRGYENLKTITKAAFNRGVKYVSAYVFSTENWNRAEDEINGLFNFVFRVASKTIKELVDNNIRICILGSRQGLNAKLNALCDEAEQKSKDNTGGTLALCFNYGGLQEITTAVKEIVKKGIPANQITETTITEHLYHPEVPAIDLMIRSSGEQRISNFMLWRMAYAELYFSDKYWPAFTEHDLDIALQNYTNRSRRFGT